jgi:hypothetical protein
MAQNIESFWLFWTRNETSDFKKFGRIWLLNELLGCKEKFWAIELDTKTASNKSDTTCNKSGENLMVHPVQYERMQVKLLPN